MNRCKQSWSQLSLVGEADQTLFDRCVYLAVQGKDINAIAHALYETLDDEERLWLLDGDESYWSGRQEVMNGNYNIRPYVMGEIPRLGIPGIRFVDGPRGCVSGQGTAFPVSMARGATWDVELEERVGKAIGEEVAVSGGNYFGGVCINLPRHPAWGRAQETYAENPLILGEMGAALARGVKPYAMACVKHFACNSMENSRFQVDVSVDEATLHEEYLPHFKKVIEAGALGVMSAYNKVNGEYCGQNSYLLKQVLRHDWDFQGIVGSDFVWGLRDAAASVKAGLNIEEPFRQQRAEHLRHQLQDGEVTWEDIRTIAEQILAAQIIFYAQQKKRLLSMKGSLNVNSAKYERSVNEDPQKKFHHHALLAREVAERSVVLLKNNNRVLPLAKGRYANTMPLATDPFRIAVAGRLAAKENTGDDGSSKVRAPYAVTVLEGLTQTFGEHSIVDVTQSDSEMAAQQAATTDCAVVVVGYTANDEGEYLKPSMDESMLKLLPTPTNDAEQEIIDRVNESIKAGKSTFGSDAVGGDRQSLRLHEDDVDLINRISSVNARTIVVVVCAGAVLMDDWIEKPAAVLLGWYAGQEGGIALAEILAGTVNPSGRLPYSIPSSEKDLPEFESTARSITYTRWYGQRLIAHNHSTALFPLGYGLSYTDFCCEMLDVNQAEISDDRTQGVAHIRVRNTGNQDGYYIAQIYAVQLQGIRRGERELIGFASMNIAAGTCVDRDIQLDFTRIGQWNAHKRSICVNKQKVRIELSSYWGDIHALSKEIVL